MITYKDRAFCSSETHKPDCRRIITQEELEHAKEIGLPIAYGNFCGDVDTIDYLKSELAKIND